MARPAGLWPKLDTIRPARECQAVRSVAFCDWMIGGLTAVSRTESVMQTHIKAVAGKLHLKHQVGRLLGGIACVVATQGIAIAQEARRPLALEDVIVTATRRDASVRDVAASVSAFSQDQLTLMGAQSLSDYITKMPGVHFNDYQPGVSEVIIRGVSATTYHEQGQTTVGYYINEVPLSEAGWPVVIPDVDTFDLRRVELLRGPQGTLFGSATLGGLVNYVVNEADPSGFDAAVETLLGSTKGAEDVNYAVKGMVNVPLSEDKLALRVVGLQRFDAGYIDNITTGESATNDLTTTGARLSLVWQLTDRTKVSLLSMYQEMELDDQTYVLIDGGRRRDAYIWEPHDTELMVNSLRLDQDLGIGTLTVLGSYSEKEGNPVFDGTPTQYLQGNFTPTAFDSNVDSEAAHFEVRLASDDEGPVTWLIGAAYYDSDKGTFDVTHQPGAAAFIDANPGSFGGFPGSLLAPDDNLNRYIVDQANEDLGIYGELSFRFASTWTATIGGRYYDTESDTTVTRPPSASFLGAFDPVGSEYRELQSEDGITPKASIAWRPRDGFMAYALYSEGYRLGGANPNPPGLTGVPTSYDSDTVNNYEIGVRTGFADDSVLLDVTAFHIDWNDMQVRLFTPAPYFYSYVSNAGGADVDGVELSLGWQTGELFDMQAAVTWQDAAVSSFVEDTFAPGGGHPAGTTLPGSSEWTTALTLGFNFSLPLDPRLEITHRYLSEAPVAFSSVNERGDFHLVDLRVTATLNDQISLALIASNIFDEYGTLNAPFADFYAIPLGTVTRPATVGLRMNVAF